MLTQGYRSPRSFQPSHNPSVKCPAQQTMLTQYLVATNANTFLQIFPCQSQAAIGTAVNSTRGRTTYYSCLQMMQETGPQKTQGKMYWVYEMTQTLGLQTQELKKKVSTRLIQMKTHRVSASLCSSQVSLDQSPKLQVCCHCCQNLRRIWTSLLSGSQKTCSVGQGCSSGGRVLIRHEQSPAFHPQQGVKQYLTYL